MIIFCGRDKRMTPIFMFFSISIHFHGISFSPTVSFQFFYARWIKMKSNPYKNIFSPSLQSYQSYRHLKIIVNIDCSQLFSLNFVAKTYILHTSFVSSARFTLMVCRLHTPYSALMKYQKPVAKGDVRGPKKDWYKLLELAESCSK